MDYDYILKYLFYFTNKLLPLGSFKFDVVYKLWDIILLENINTIYIFICQILRQNKSYILSSNKENIIKDLNEITEFVKIDSLVREVVQHIKMIPQSLIPIQYEYNEDVLKELNNNEFFKNRWWEFKNFYCFNPVEIIIPTISIDDVTRFIDKVIRTNNILNNIRLP